MYRGEYILKAKPVQDIEERAVILGRYILENKATVRAAAIQINLYHILGYPNPKCIWSSQIRKYNFCYFVGLWI